MSDFAKVHELYTPLSSALAKLHERRSDAVLQQRVRTYFSRSQNPAFFNDEPYAVFAPAMITPNLELISVLDIARSLPLKTLYLEYSHDKFVHLNSTKRCLGHMYFYDIDSHGIKRVSDELRIVDFQNSQGKPMNEIQTVYGENFVSFHHRLAREYLKADAPHSEDFSEWFIRGKYFEPQYPYLRYLGLFLTDAILLANFTTEKHEAVFTDEKVLPAFRKLKEDLGITPLIVPVEPTEVDSDHFWCYYPKEVRQLC